jgi:hypothetical protein
LIENAQFSARDLGVRDGAVAADVCAEVVRNPSNPDVFGLKNLTRAPWQATVASGQTRSVEPGKSVKLAKGTRVSIGKSSIQIE